MELFAAPGVAPFAIALGLLLTLTFLELLAAIFGMSLLSLGGDADVDLDLDVDVDADVDLDAGGDVDALDAASAGPSGIGSAMLWLGLGRAPFLVWLATFLAGFGLSGLLVQSLVLDLSGALLPLGFALLAAIPIGAIAAKFIATGIARLLPRVQTTAVKREALGGRLGVITGADGRRGRPTEARVKDPYGRSHYLRVEPLDDDAVLANGQDVIVFRKPVGGIYRAMAYDDAAAS